jgi:hypothetical protein
VRVTALGVGVLAAFGVALWAAATGAAGPLTLCGADGLALCASWPRGATLMLWAASAALVVALLAWQLRQR